MLLAIDIGNSSIGVGVFDISNTKAPMMITNIKISTKDLSSDEFTILLKDFLARDQIYPAHTDIANDRVIDAAVISSVVPRLTNALMQSAKNICGKCPLLITDGIRTGIRIHLHNPEQLGTDIVCNAVAAIDHFAPPAVLLDMGTATTITYIDKKLTIQGIAICPGLAISLHALSDSAAQISDIVLEEKPSLLGKNTRSAVCSGILNGNAFMIDGFVRNIREELAATGATEKLSLIATGGLAPLALPYLRNKFTYVESLTLQGLAVLYLKNHKSV